MRYKSTTIHARITVPTRITLWVHARFLAEMRVVACSTVIAVVFVAHKPIGQAGPIDPQNRTRRIQPCTTCIEVIVNAIDFQPPVSKHGTRRLEPVPRTAVIKPSSFHLECGRVHPIPRTVDILPTRLKDTIGRCVVPSIATFVRSVFRHNPTRRHVNDTIRIRIENRISNMNHTWQ